MKLKGSGEYKRSKLSHKQNLALAIFMLIAPLVVPAIVVILNQ